MNQQSKPLILVVDDEQYIRQLIKRILEGGGYQVITASGGREALSRLTEASFDLILLDLRMPELDGFRTLELIRKQYSTPALMVTGTADVMPATKALNLNDEDYIRKPFQPSVLLDKVKAKLAFHEGLS